MAVNSTPDAPNVTVEVYDPAVLTYLFPEWPALTKREKLAYIRRAVPPARERAREHNVTCVGLHEFLPKVLDPDQTDELDVSHLGLGDDDASFAAGDTALNTEQGRVVVTEAAVSGTQIDYEVFVDSSELNGVTLRELGLFTGPASDSAALLLNHAAVSPTVDKTNSKTVVFTVSLSFSAA
jgi:hypothetical protein